MNFKEGQPIYVQIAERLSDEILAGTFRPETRVPGVREYSALLEVNTNTTVKAYDQLAQRGIIVSRRGMGYYVTPDAPRIIAEERRRYFREYALPDFIRHMKLLGITLDEVAKAYHSTDTEA